MKPATHQKFIQAHEQFFALEDPELRTQQRTTIAGVQPQATRMMWRCYAPLKRLTGGGGRVGAKVAVQKATSAETPLTD